MYPLLHTTNRFSGWIEIQKRLLPHGTVRVLCDKSLAVSISRGSSPVLTSMIPALSAVQLLPFIDQNLSADSSDIAAHLLTYPPAVLMNVR